MIAHRGVSGLECENTCAAFVAAGNRSYYGIETDTHVTADGKFAIIHDSNTLRVSGVDAKVEELPYEALKDIRLYDKEEGVTRSDLVIPALVDYIRICHRYNKVSVLELKGPSSPEHYPEMLEIIRANEHWENTIFISFGKQNALDLRAIAPDAKIQFLTSTWDDALLPWLLEHHFDLDIDHRVVTKDLVDLIHANGMEINCWTVNHPERGEELAAMGVDYITTNILE
jgi:glycerophosphoryl diester phosphodiesterase